MSDFDRLDALRLRFDAQPTRFGVPYAEALRRAGQLEGAVAAMRTVLARQERNVLALAVLARCLRDLGHPEEAGIAVRSALALDSDDPVLTELAYLVPFAPAHEEEVTSEPVNAPADAPVEAVPRPMEPIVEPAPMPSVFVTQTMAELYVQQGLPGRAVAIYRELTMRAPDDARLVARLAEVVALAESLGDSEPPAIVERLPERARDDVHAAWLDEAIDEAIDESLEDAPADSLGDLPLLEDFDPTPVVDLAPEADRVAQWFVQDASDPESLGDEPRIPSAFDFSGDADRVAPPIDAMDESILAGLSFEAISLPTPAPDGAGLDLPLGAGPSAREALRQLASRPLVSRAPRRPPVVPPVLRPTARHAATGTTPTKRAGPPADPTGDDFDQWLRGVS